MDSTFRRSSSTVTSRPQLQTQIRQNVLTVRPIRLFTPIGIGPDARLDSIFRRLPPCNYPGVSSEISHLPFCSSMVTRTRVFSS